jgi:hypothetical protein
MSQPSPEPVVAPKRRSRIERMVVWGLIAALLFVVAVEGRSWWGFMSAYRPIVAQLHERDKVGGSLKEADVQDAVGGMAPTREPIYGILRHADREDTYVWRGLLKDRTMYVYYGVGDDPDVLFVTTVKEPPPEEFNWEAFGYVRSPQGAKAEVQPVSNIQ